jgi:hypothetical protein
MLELITADPGGRAVKGVGLLSLAGIAGSNPVGGLNVCLFRTLSVVR